MRTITRFLRFRRNRAAEPMAPTSLVAFAHLDADQQALVAQSLIASRFEQGAHRKAS